MASPLRLFGVFCKDEHPSVLNQGNIPLHYGHRWDYWGLRTSPHDAVERALLFGQNVTKESHLVFEVAFSIKGYVQYTLTPWPGKRYLLLYCSDMRFGVWHLQCPIPLVDRDAATQEPLLEVFWHEIV